MWCSDPLLNLLQPLGYCVVRLPRADLRPLELLSARRRDLDRLGELTTVLNVDDVSLVPQIAYDRPVANISGKRTGSLSMGLGLGLLGNIVAAMGGSPTSLEAAYRGARSISFELMDVLEDRTEVARLDQYLATADIDPKSRHVGALFESDRLYVTTATLKSASIRVTGQRASGGRLHLSVPELQAAVGADVSLAAHGTDGSTIDYRGTQALVFGFQAIQLFYYEGRYAAFEPASTRMAMRGSRAPRNATFLDSDAPFVQLGN
jgi:hypothetical protein